MANRTFADLSQFQAAALKQQQAAGNPLDALIGGVQQGVQLQRLPQTLQENALNQQVAQAIQQAKLRELQSGKTFEVGNSLIRQNPQTGAFETVFTAPSAPSTPKDDIFNVGGVLLQRTPEGVKQLYAPPEKPQSFSPGSLVGTLEDIRQGKGTRIPDKEAVEKPFILSPGQKVFAADGKTVIAENPSNATADKPIVVSPGSRVIDATGKEIFNNPAISKSASSTRPPTEGQSNYQLYGTRMGAANKVLEEMKDFDPVEGASYLPNRLKSEERQAVEQAERDFLTAVLRKESGATLTDEELENGRIQYFRQPGDTQKTINQKRANRALVISEFKRLGGSPMDSFTEISSQEQYDALPSGAEYMEEGVRYRKP